MAAVGGLLNVPGCHCWATESSCWPLRVHHKCMAAFVVSLKVLSNQYCVTARSLWRPSWGLYKFMEATAGCKSSWRPLQGRSDILGGHREAAKFLATVVGLLEVSGGHHKELQKFMEANVGPPKVHSGCRKFMATTIEHPESS